MRFLVVSLGSIGRRHLANLRHLEPDAEIVVWRRQSRDTSIPPDANGLVFSQEDALAWNPEAAIIAAPAAEHVPAALALARRRVALLIEKPIATSLEQADELISVCREHDVRAMVGYHLRFSPSLTAMRNAVCAGLVGCILSIRAEVGQYLPEWRSGCDYRQSVSARRALGGGAIFELSHELDYVRWIGGEIDAVSAETGRLSDLEIDVEDHAEILLRFASQAIGSVHLDMAQRSPVRVCRVSGTQGTLLWDGIAGSVRLYQPGSGWADWGPPAGTDRNEMFLAEMRAFLQCVRTGSEPPVTPEQGRRVLEIALAAKRAACEHRRIEVTL